MKDQTVISMSAAKQNIERKKHASRVLDAFDRLDHSDRMVKAEKRSEVEREARKKL